MADTDASTASQPAREHFPTVSATIVHNGKILLRRDQQQYNWLAPHTHIGIDETPIMALFRHVKHETGLPQQNLTALLPYVDNLQLERGENEGATEPLPFDIHIHQVGQGTHYHVDYSYILISNTDELTPETDEKIELQWFDEEEVKELMMTTKITISRALYALERDADRRKNSDDDSEES